jgi:hypothetical protein
MYLLNIPSTVLFLHLADATNVREAFSKQRMVDLYNLLSFISFRVRVLPGLCPPFI